MKWCKRSGKLNAGGVRRALSQIVDYIFYVIYALLGMRFLLALLAARSSRRFRTVHCRGDEPVLSSVSRNRFQPEHGSGGTRLMMPIIIAIIAYLLLHLAINGILRMLAHRKTEI